jgi:hypothetical protein
VEGVALPGGSTVRPPVVREVRARHTAEVVFVDLLLDRVGSGRTASFGPQMAGGWCFQMFLDTDQQPTGYGAGLDYLVRAIEMVGDRGAHVRRTIGGSGPGGWGESVGQVGIGVSTDLVSFTLPLEILGPDDGEIDFVLELYQTVACDDGVVHEFVAGYSGTTTRLGGASAPLEIRLTPVAAGAKRIG